MTDALTATRTTPTDRRRPVGARRRLAVLVAGVVVLAGATAGCSSESESEVAAQKVCTARDDLRASAGQVREALTAANLGTAREAMDTVRTDFDALRTATAELSDAERERLQPQIDTVRTQIEALADVRDLAGLEAGIAAIGTSLEEIYAEVAETLDCP